MRGLAIYRDLLRNRPLTRLLGREFVCGIGDWLYIVALLIVVYRETDDIALLRLFSAVRMLPYPQPRPVLLPHPWLPRAAFAAAPLLASARG